MSSSFKTVSKASLGLCLLLSTGTVLAAVGDIGSVATQIVTSFAGVVKLITAISYVAGMGFALAGIMKFKTHRDNPQQVPLSQPIVLVAVAAALLFMPGILQSAGATIFGADAASQGGKLGGFCGIDTTAAGCTAGTPPTP